MGTTESQRTTATQLKRIAWLSARDADKQFECLMHHFNEESLKVCYQELDGRKARGVDGIDKAMYGENLDSNLKALVERMKRMGYRPGNVREVRIPKEGKKGATRPLGIANFEDKLVQKMMQKVLESIYEPLLSKQMFGFRPRQGCHDAIKALSQHLYEQKVQTIIDVDLENYFGSIDHKQLEAILREKIKDERFIRYVIRMFKAGILADGELKTSDEGVPQGSPASPILSNIYANRVVAKWFEETVNAHCRGKVEIFVYADDMVIACERHEDALRIKKALASRLEKYGLKMNQDKTKLVRFSRSAHRRDEKQGVFDFLGFTFYIGKSRNGYSIVQLRTSKKKFKLKLRQMKEWIKLARNRMPLNELWKLYCKKLRGHINYYGVSHNFRWVEAFSYRTRRIMFKWLNRRSQRKSFNWEKFATYMERNPLPVVRIKHRLF